MANLTSTLTVRLIDAVTGPARAAANSIRGIGTAVDQTNTRRLAIAGAVNAMGRDVGRATRDLSRNVSRMTTGLSMPTGFATWFGARSVYDFEKTSNALQAVTMMTGEQRKEIQGLAKDLNELFPFTNAEIMSAAFELGRAGFKYQEIVGVLKDTLNLALAGDIDLQESADIATNVLTAMRLPMKTTEQAAESLRRVNDALSYAAANSNTDVRMMGETFKYVGPMAAAAGMSIEHVAAASMVMAKNGIRASEAGVAMRSALVRMVRPTNPMLAALHRLNVNIDDFVKRGRQITSDDVINSLMADGVDASAYAAQIEAALKDPKLASSLKKLTTRLTDIIAGDGSIMDKSKLAEAISDTLTAAGSEVDFFGFLEALKEKGADLGDIARIFDARQGARLITLLSGDLLGELENVRANAPGATDEMARIRMQGVVGDWAALVAATENFFLALADAGVLKTATEVIKSITEGLKSLAAANPQLLETATYALVLAGILGPLGMLLGGVASGFLAIFAALRLMKAAGFGAAGVAGAGIFGGGTAAAGGAAAGGAAAAAGKGWFSRLLRGAGAVGIGLAVKEVLELIDPQGNLWGLTSGIDAWAEKHLGFNPSKVGGGGDQGPTLSKAEAAAADIAEWRARQAEIDARLAQIEANMHPSMRGAPNPERDRLLMDRAMLQQQIDLAGATVKVSELDALLAQQAEVDTLLREIEANTQPVFRETLERARDRLQPDRATVPVPVPAPAPAPVTLPALAPDTSGAAEAARQTSDAYRQELERAQGAGTAIEGSAPTANPAQAAEAARQTMIAYRDQVRVLLAEIEQMAAQSGQRIAQSLSFTARPTISPRIDGAAIRGVHADVGVE